MLMPAKNGDAENIAFAPVVAAIFYKTVSIAGDDIVYLFVHMAMRARALAGRDLGEQRAQHAHEKSGLWIDHVAHPAHRCFLEFDTGAIHRHAARAPPLFFAAG